jgi:hypothetical protein
MRGINEHRTSPRAFAAMIAALGLLLGGGIARAEGQAPGQAATRSTPSAAPAPGVLPSPVARAEGLAEDVQTDLEQNRWTAAGVKLRELRDVEGKFASAGVAQDKRSAYGNAVSSLGAAIDRKSQGDALTAGNRVSRIVTGIMADYRTRVPADVAWMDVAGRDALYASQQGRWGDAAGAAAEVSRSYAAVQAHVRGRDAALDRRITGEIASLHHAAASRARDRGTSVARALLEDVDRIEQTY